MLKRSLGVLILVALPLVVAARFMEVTPERDLALQPLSLTGNGAGEPHVASSPAPASPPVVGANTQPPAERSFSPQESVEVNTRSHLRLELRSAPGFGGAPLKQVRNGTRLTITEGPVEADGHAWWGFEEGGWTTSENIQQPGEFALPPLYTPGDVVEANTHSSNQLAVRSEPGAGAPELKSVPNGARLQLIEGPLAVEGENWWSVAEGGWVPEDAIQYPGEFPLAAAFAPGDRVSIIEVPEAVALRNAPTADASEVRSVPAGTVLEVSDGPVVSEGVTWWGFEGGGWAPQDLLTAATAPSVPEVTVAPGDVLTVNPEEELVLRNGPGVGTSELRRVPAGGRLQVVDGPIAFDGTTWLGFKGGGWAPVDVVQDVATALTGPAFEAGARVEASSHSGDAVPVLREPAADAPLLREVENGAVLEIAEGPVAADGHRWWRLADGGWVLEEDLQVASTSSSLEPGDAVEVVTETGQLVLRSEPATDAEELRRLTPGAYAVLAEGPVSADGIEWWAVEGGGWAPAESFQPPTYAVGDRVEINNETGPLILRMAPNPAASGVRRVLDGTQLEIVGGPSEEGGVEWWLFEGGGWAPADALRPALEAPVALNLALGETVQVNTRSQERLVLRAEASSSAAEIVRLRSGSNLRIVAGPVEAEGQRWWQFKAGGWASEQYLQRPGDGRLPPAFAAGDGVEVNSRSRQPLAIRMEPGDDASIVGELRNGTPLRIAKGPVGADGKIWWQFEEGGWATGEFIQYPGEAALPPLFRLRDMVVASTQSWDWLEIREQASSFAPTLRLVPSGTLLEIVDGPVRADGVYWWGLKNGGWARQDQLQLPAAFQPQVPAASSGISPVTR